MASLAERVKNDFPLLQSGIAYLDSASTTLKPQSVISKITEYYTKYPANVHRGIYRISDQASEEFERVRGLVQRFIGAEHEEEIIFTSGTTHGLNLVALLLEQQLQPGDEVIVSNLEHHANLIPWQMLAKRVGIKLKFLITDDDQKIDPRQLDELINSRTKVLSISHGSNVSGYSPPVKELAATAHKHGMIVVVDGAQSTPYKPVNVVELGADFFAFSGHKMCGPTGVGVLYGKKELLEQLEPVVGGGSMIDEVTLESATWAPIPAKFEPGTPNIAGVIGLGAAIEYLSAIGMEEIQRYEADVFTYAVNQFQSELPSVTMYGPTDLSSRSGIISFAAKGVHPHDMASVLDQENVAVRAGHHCAQPLMKHWGVPSTTRASMYFYNTREDIDRLILAIKKAQNLFTV